MSDYIVSARKYRPDSFETLVGQDNIARTLKNSVLRGQLAHAYLFCGPRGVGKTSTARIFAKIINCSNPSAEMEPCGECESCKAFQEGRSYCIHELDAASNNSVDDIRELMEKVQIPPQVGKYSVYIIDEVHMLSSQAFNAFLKTLEEPPAHAIFILATTEKHKILPTILSRCQTYDFNRISILDMVRNLRAIAQKENVSVDEKSLHVIAAKADGAMRDALTLFDQTVAFCGTDVHYEDVINNLNVLDSEYSFRLVDAFLAGDYKTALLIFDEILAKGFNAQYFISSVGEHLRNLLVSKTGGLESLLDVPDTVRADFKKQADGCSVKFLYDALGVISQCEAGYKAAVNQRLHIEFSLMRLSFLAAAPSPAVAAETRPAPSVAVAPAAAPAPAPAPAVAPAPAASPAPAVETAPAAAPAPVKPVQPAPEKKEEENADVIELPMDELSIQLVEEKPAEPEKQQQKKAVSAKKTAPFGISVSDMLSGEEPELAPLEEKASADSVPSDEVLTQAWKELPSQYSSQPRMANMLANSTIQMEESDGVKVLSFSVVNESQRSWVVQNHQRKIEKFLRDRCGSSKVSLRIDLIPEEQQEQKLYLPSEKAQELMSNNPEVNSLVLDLGLDIK